MKNSDGKYFGSRRQVGFTILELMTGISILGILLAIGIPSYRDVSAANKVTAATNEFVTALNLTRSEATKRGTQVSLCPADSALSTCVSSTTWSTGWIAFTDDGATPGAIDTGETIIQKWPAEPSDLSHASTGATYVRYARDGTANTATYNLRQAVPVKYQRCILVSNSGQIRLDKSGAVC